MSESLAPAAALERLIEGNRRFHTRTPAHEGPGRRLFDASYVEGQRPFAIVVGCSDSRTPVEILFDQGFGDLFVVRVAGNVASPAVFGSVEFAASRFGTRLVVVLGHTRCGAIDATLDVMTRGATPESQHVSFITDLIAPNIESVVHAAGTDAHGEPGAAHDHDLHHEATRANVLASVAALQRESALLAELVAAGRVRVVGAEYALETGRVSFFN
jgi:carbonic anhydrase